MSIIIYMFGSKALRKMGASSTNLLHRTVGFSCFPIQTAVMLSCRVIWRKHDLTSAGVWPRRELYFLIDFFRKLNLLLWHCTHTGLEVLSVKSEVLPVGFLYLYRKMTWLVLHARWTFYPSCNMWDCRSRYAGLPNYVDCLLTYFTM